VHNPFHTILWERYEPPTVEDATAYFNLISKRAGYAPTGHRRDRTIHFLVVTEVEMDHRLLDYLHQQDCMVGDAHISIQVYRLLPGELREVVRMRLARLARLGVIRLQFDPKHPEGCCVQLAQEYYPDEEAGR
jgi:hypothetical protein